MPIIHQEKGLEGLRKTVRIQGSPGPATLRVIVKRGNTEITRNEIDVVLKEGETLSEEQLKQRVIELLREAGADEYRIANLQHSEQRMIAISHKEVINILEGLADADNKAIKNIADAIAFTAIFTEDQIITRYVAETLRELKDNGAIEDIANAIKNTAFHIKDKTNRTVQNVAETFREFKDNDAIITIAPCIIFIASYPADPDITNKVADFFKSNKDKLDIRRIARRIYDSRGNSGYDEGRGIIEIIREYEEGWVDDLLSRMKEDLRSRETE